MAQLQAIHVPLSDREWVNGKAELMGFVGVSDKDTLRKYYLSPSDRPPLLPWRKMGAVEFFLKADIRAYIDKYGMKITGDAAADTKHHNYKKAAQARMQRWEQERKEA